MIMIEFTVDEAAYSEVACGLVRRVIASLIEQLADKSVLDLSGELSERDLSLVFNTVQDILVQFEDFRGHCSGAFRHPVVVGFMRVPIDDMVAADTPEVLLVSRRRADLHGGIENDLIRDVFEEIQLKRRQSNFGDCT